MATERTYDRTWAEIETMLARAEKKMRKWKDFFEDCRERGDRDGICLLYTSPSPRELSTSRMPSSA